MLSRCVVAGFPRTEDRSGLSKSRPLQEAQVPRLWRQGSVATGPVKDRRWPKGALVPTGHRHSHNLNLFEWKRNTIP